MTYELWLLFTNKLLTHLIEVISGAWWDIPKRDNSNSIFEHTGVPTLKSKNPIYILRFIDTRKFELIFFWQFQRLLYMIGVTIHYTSRLKRDCPCHKHHIIPFPKNPNVHVLSPQYLFTFSDPLTTSISKSRTKRINVKSLFMIFKESYNKKMYYKNYKG